MVEIYGSVMPFVGKIHAHLREESVLYCILWGRGLKIEYVFV